MKTAFHKGLRGVSGLLVGILFLYSATLTQATPYNTAVLADNPLLYWTFDESSGDAFSQVNNTSDNKLAPQGAATRAASLAGLGSAASFNGVDGTGFKAADLFGATYTDVPGHLWAVEFWFHPDTSDAKYISEARGGPSNKTNTPAFLFGYGTPSPTNALEVNNASQTSPRPGILGVAPGEWHHMVFAFYGDKANTVGNNLRELWLDGVKVVSDTAGTFSAEHGLRDFVVGGTLGLQGVFLGAIDEYAIYQLNTSPDFAARQARVANIAGHFNAVPEPSSTLLLGLGLVGLAAFRRRKSI